MRPETRSRLSRPLGGGQRQEVKNRHASSLSLRAASSLPMESGPQRRRPDGGHLGAAEPAQARHPPELPWGDPQEEEPREGSRVVTATRLLFLRPGCGLCRTCLFPVLLTDEPYCHGVGSPLLSSHPQCWPQESRSGVGSKRLGAHLGAPRGRASNWGLRQHFLGFRKSGGP